MVHTCAPADVTSRRPCRPAIVTTMCAACVSSESTLNAKRASVVVRSTGTMPSSEGSKVRFAPAPTNRPHVPYERGGNPRGAVRAMILLVLASRMMRMPSLKAIKRACMNPEVARTSAALTFLRTANSAVSEVRALTFLRTANSAVSLFLRTFWKTRHPKELALRARFWHLSGIGRIDRRWNR